jgi:GAF domain-containing protein
LLTVVNGQFDNIAPDRPDAPFGSLKIALAPGVARRLQPGAAELRGDVFGRDLKAARRSVAAFEQVGRDEREVAAQRIRLDAVERGLKFGRYGRSAPGLRFALTLARSRRVLAAMLRQPIRRKAGGHNRKGQKAAGHDLHWPSISKLSHET